MLILTRKTKQSVHIGEDIKVTVTNVTTNADGKYIVSLGFDAPSHISIDREEIRTRRIENINNIFNVKYDN